MLEVASQSQGMQSGVPRSNNRSEMGSMQNKYLNEFVSEFFMENIPNEQMKQ